MKNGRSVCYSLSCHHWFSLRNVVLIHRLDVFRPDLAFCAGRDTDAHYPRRIAGRAHVHEKGRRGYGMTSPKDGMLPAAFIALMVFVLIVTLDTSVLPITVLLDTLATWWLITLFLITLKDGLFNEKKGVK